MMRHLNPGIRMSNLQFLEICTDPHPDASIIWLHGLGADGYDFAPVIEMMQPLPAVRFILPHAPQRPVTINGGYVMPAWYDVYGRDLADRQDEAGIRASQLQIEVLVAQEKSRGIASERTVIAGFSQGGAIALHTALRHREKLGGIIALSTYLPLHETLAEEQSPLNRDTPIFMAHGQFDEVIPQGTGRMSAAFLSRSGYQVDWREYAMGHSVCNDEIVDIRDFIIRTLTKA
jgi:phospholipase/carboxylesterase